MRAPRRILVVKLASLGDVLTATPAVRALRATFPDSHVGVLTTPASAPALRGLDTVDEVLLDCDLGAQRIAVGVAKKSR